MSDVERPASNDLAHLGDLAATALSVLVCAGVEHRVRKPFDPVRGELDLWVARESGAACARALALVGLHPLAAYGHGDHRFFVGFDGERWLKVDAKLEPARDARGPGARSALARVRPTSLRRLGPVVALLGPDGAGKGTVVEGLRSQIPIGVTCLYLGRRRWGGRAASARPSRERPAGTARECAFVLRAFLRSWRLLAVGYAAAWRGHVVLCDRHPLEVLAVRPKRVPAAARLERILATRFTPRPDAIVVLDAPAETLSGRKAEHPVEVLERWRAAYREAFPDARVISTTGAPEETVAAASAVVWEALRARRRWSAEPRVTRPS